MKKLLLAFVAIATVASMSAQLPDGSIAPDWTGTDINGVTHNLYDDLDAGKSVIMDVSATWCGPCWGYHTGGALESIWEEHGPDGTDDVRVYMFEADASTTQADLEGTGPDTQGDWITDTGYPIIDDASINTPYEVGYYPTIYTICPSRELVESGQISGAEHWNYIQANCAAASVDVDATILSYLAPTEVCSGGGHTPEVRVMNLNADGTSMTAATIETYVDGSLNSSYDWTGDLALYEYDDVTLPEITGVSGAIEVEVVVVVAGDLDTSNDGVSADVSVAAVGYGSVTLTLLTDNYGAETSWEMKNLDGDVIASGGGYGNATEYTEVIDFPADDCYEFFLYDSYGDGICCAWGIGGYTLEDSQGNVLQEGGEFAEVDVTLMGIANATSLEENGAAQFQLYPNPSAGAMTLNLEEELGQFDVFVSNALGQRVYNETFQGGTRVELDLDLPAGNYTLEVRSEAVAGVKRITIK